MTETKSLPGLRLMSRPLRFIESSMGSCCGGNRNAHGGLLRGASQCAFRSRDLFVSSLHADHANGALITRHPKRVRSLIIPTMRHISDVLADVLRGLAPALTPETAPEAPPHSVRPAPASSPRSDARVSPSLCRILP